MQKPEYISLSLFPSYAIFALSFTSTYKSHNTFIFALNSYLIKVIINYNYNYNYKEILKWGELC